MGILTEKIENNQVFRELDELESMLGLAKDRCQEDEGLIEYWGRSSSIVRYARKILTEADTMLISLSALNSLNTSFQSAKSEISLFIGNGNPGHWDNVQIHLDSALSHLSVIPAQTVSGIEDMRKSAEEYRSSINVLLNKIKSDVGNLVKLQGDLQSKINDAAGEVVTQKQRIDNAIAGFQQQFSEAQQIRQNEYSLEKTQRQADELKAAEYATIEHETLVKNLNSTAAELLEVLEDRKDHAQKLVGIIANTGMAFGFQKTANDERDAARTWKVVAACSLGVWIVVGCIFFALTYDKDLTLAAVARQFMISTPFVLLSGFAALQVSRHQKNERGLRQSELEIASIDPFLSTLSDEDRNMVKREFATRYFGQRETDSKQQDAPPSNLIELVGTLTKLVQELVKKE